MLMKNCVKFGKLLNRFAYQGHYGYDTTIRISSRGMYFYGRRTTI